MKTPLFVPCSHLVETGARSDMLLQCVVEGDDPGPVFLVYGRHVAVFPNAAEARRAAEAALHPEVGGFKTVALYRAPVETAITHATLEDWLLD